MYRVFCHIAHLVAEIRKDWYPGRLPPWAHRRRFAAPALAPLAQGAGGRAGLRAVDYGDKHSSAESWREPHGPGDLEQEGHHEGVTGRPARDQGEAAGRGRGRSRRKQEHVRPEVLGVCPEPQDTAPGADREARRGGYDLEPGPRKLQQPVGIGQDRGHRVSRPEPAANRLRD